ncbi:pyocin knob domain-containing protein [uncultured Bacteroides sp.]|uniref:pyocin knob domain-containing protein n=1 Tax=uncultured Bacteroides sp. TaxID=162156 RepID=UPI002616A470|nr:pyocin knob domain-containing protein [uncultured Bacteroides sp.]
METAGHTVRVSVWLGELYKSDLSFCKKIFELSASSAYIGNLGDISVTSIYRGDKNCTDIPAGLSDLNGAIIITFVFDIAAMRQIVIPYNTETIYIRRKLGTSWLEWKKVQPS